MVVFLSPHPFAFVGIFALRFSCKQISPTFLETFSAMALSCQELIISLRFLPQHLRTAALVLSFSIFSTDFLLLLSLDRLSQRCLHDTQIYKLKLRFIMQFCSFCSSSFAKTAERTKQYFVFCFAAFQTTLYSCTLVTVTSIFSHSSAREGTVCGSNDYPAILPWLLMPAWPNLCVLVCMYVFVHI